MVSQDNYEQKFLFANWTKKNYKQPVISCLFFEPLQPEYLYPLLVNLIVEHVTLRQD